MARDGRRLTPMMHHVEVTQTINGLQMKCRCGIVATVECEKHPREQEQQIGEFFAEHEAPSWIQVFFWNLFRDFFGDDRVEAAA
jgi:hypothetical protein